MDLRLSSLQLTPRRVIALLAVAALVRLFWALLVPVAPLSDSHVYHLFATEMAAGRGYVFPAGNPTVYWAVGAPAIYAFGYWLFGQSYAVVVAANLLLGVGFVGATVWLAYNRLGSAAALISGWLLVFWPVWVQFTTVLNSELPFVCLLALAMAVQSEKRLDKWARTTGFAVLIAAAIYVRPIALPLALLVPFLSAAREGKWGQGAVDALLAVAIVGTLLAPWAYRNKQHFGSPVLVSANFGANLWMGNNPRSDGGYMGLPDIDSENEVSRDAFFKDRAIRFILENPGRYLELSIQRVRLSFDRESIGVAWNAAGLPDQVETPLKLLSAAYWYLMLLFGTAGLLYWLLERWSRLFDPLTAASATFAAIALLVVGMDRYHLPLAPFIAIFAASAMLRLLGRFAARGFSKAPLAA